MPGIVSGQNQLQYPECLLHDQEVQQFVRLRDRRVHITPSEAEYPEKKERHFDLPQNTTAPNRKLSLVNRAKDQPNQIE